MINQLMVLVQPYRRNLIATLWLIGLAGGYSPWSHAATECLFSPAGTVTISSVSNSGYVTLPSSEGWLPYEYDSGQSKNTTCNTGPDGQGLYGWSSATPSKSVTVSGGYSAALYETNVPGIYYAVKIKSAATPPNGYISSSTSAGQAIYSISDDNDKAYLNGNKHIFYIQLYRDSSYVADGTSVSYITPKTTGTVGHFRYGSDTSASDETVTVNVSNFSIPIQLPSCNASLSSQNATGTTVNMGTYTPEAIKSGATAPIPFSISLTNCANAGHAVVKLTSNQFDSSTGYMKNTGNDMGAGIKITQVSNGAQIKPGGSTTSWTISGASTTLSMNAQLMKISDTIKTGTFVAQGTFEITYN